MKIKVYKKEQNKAGGYNLQISISLLGCRCVSGFGFTMSGEEYEQFQKSLSGERVKTSDILGKAIDRFRTIESECRKLESGVMAGYVKRSEIDLLGIVNKAKGKEKAKTQTQLQSAYNSYVADLANRKSIAEGSEKNVMKISRLLNEYGKTLEQISTYEGFSELSNWLQNTKRLNNTTAKCYMGMVGTFLRWCNNRGFCGADFLRFDEQLKTPDIKEKAVIYLTIDELHRLESLDLKGIADEVRDAFLFQCYTGLRVSDVRALRWYQVTGDVLRITTKKTSTFVEKKLPQQAVQILEKQKQKQVAGGCVFNTYCHRTTQRNLQNIGKMAGICDPVTITEYRCGERKQLTFEKWEKLTTHVGRKTFVVLSLSMGFTASQVIKETGHATIRTLQPYIDITEESRNEIADRWSKLKKD